MDTNIIIISGGLIILAMVVWVVRLKMKIIKQREKLVMFNLIAHHLEKGWMFVKVHLLGHLCSVFS